MKPKTIITALLLAFVVIVLFNNKEESSFWLFGDIRTSKLIILAVFFLIGVITGAVLFRRKNKHPKEYGITNPELDQIDSIPPSNPHASSHLTDEDREFIRRD